MSAGAFPKMLAPDLAGTGGEMTTEQKEDQKKFDLLLNLFDLIEKNIDLSIKLTRSSLNFDYLPAVRAEKPVSIVGIVPEEDKHVFIGAELADIVIQAHERIRSGIMFALNSFKCRKTGTLDEFVMCAYIDQLLEFLGFLDEFFRLAMHGKNGLLSVDEFIGEILALIKDRVAP